MKRFGCLAYLMNKREQRIKFDSKIIKGILVGYATNNTYRVYIPETGKLKTDCDVKFDESKKGCELLYKEKKQKQMIDEKLIIVGMKTEENERTESENSDYEDAETEDLDETRDRRYR